MLHSHFHPLRTRWGQFPSHRFNPGNVVTGRRRHSVYLLQVPGQSEHGHFFFLRCDFLQRRHCRICHFRVPQDLVWTYCYGLGMCRAAMVSSGSPFEGLRGRLYIPDSQWRVCGSKLFFLEWSCLGDHRQNFNLKFHWIVVNCWRERYSETWVEDGQDLGQRRT